jgi:hypothetical protein
LFSAFTKTIQTSILSENFPEQNFTIGYQLAPKISYLFFKTKLGFYELQNKKNKIGDLETLVQSRLALHLPTQGVTNSR